MTKWIIITIMGLVIGGLQIINSALGDYRWERDYAQAWQLADKASTLTAKREKIADFVGRLESGWSRGQFASHNAIFLQTPNNDFQSNLAALKTLDVRLSEIEKMDPTSFQYNTAIQQITAQEQGEAGALIHTFEGCWFLWNAPLVWCWIGESITCVAIIIGAIGVIGGLMRAVDKYA